jgi:uncharacterized protein with HEPN domain
VPSEQPARRFRDIVDNVGRIESYCQGLDEGRFLVDGKTIDAVERCLSRISEAAVKLGPTAEALCPDQPWLDIRHFGNQLRHGYDAIDGHRIWRTVVHDLPPLKAACLDALARLGPGQTP